VPKRRNLVESGHCGVRHDCYSDAMRDARLWKFVTLGGLVIGGVQVFSRPGANVLSVRMTRGAMLEGVWTRSDSLFRYPSWSTGQIEPDTALPDVVDRCGGASDLTAVAERAADSGYALRDKAQSMYRNDIIETIAEAVPWWRVKLWQISFGLGFWSGKLDEPSKYLSGDQIAQARRSSDNWYRRVKNRILCDAARSVKAGEPPI
jgi:hypothetical protein